MLIIEQISKDFHTGNETVDALKDVSLEVSKGEIISIIGPSGSGKTTLLHIIALLEEATSGTLIINGQAIAQLSEKEKIELRNDHIGFVFQQYQLLPSLTAVENVMLPLLAFKKDRTLKDKALDLLKKVGLQHRANHFSSRLSGGEQQRVAIARALIKNPDILLADEPTGNLDYKNSIHIMELLREINEQMGTTVITVTHNLELTKYAHNTYHMETGYLSNSEEHQSLTLNQP